VEISLPAHAKINWTLDVCGRYPAGHEAAGFTKIETIFNLIELHDLVTIRVLDGQSQAIFIEATNPDIPQSSNGNACENVCFKAISILRSKGFKVPNNDLWIGIDKNIPLAGGLGGSSTDGAAVLVALNSLFELRLSRAELIEIAGFIGSDTGFFASQYHLALGTERGDVLQALPPLPAAAHLVLINPRRELHTGAVYRSLTLGNFRSRESAGTTASKMFIAGLLGGSNLPKLGTLASNDLEAAPYIQAEFPELPALLAEMIDHGGLTARMCGSGSTVFAVYDNSQQAEQAAAQLRRRYGQWLIHVSQTI